VLGSCIDGYSVKCYRSLNLSLLKIVNEVISESSQTVVKNKKSVILTGRSKVSPSK
jgi:hypothetical protein